MTTTNAFVNYPHVDIRNDKATVFGPGTSYRNIVTGITNTYLIALDHDPVAFPIGILGDALMPVRTEPTKTRHQRHEADDGDMPSTPEPLAITQTSHAVLAKLERLAGDVTSPLFNVNRRASNESIGNASNPLRQENSAKLCCQNDQKQLQHVTCSLNISTRLNVAAVNVKGQRSHLLIIMFW
jgi:hypothetical protein